MLLGNPSGLLSFSRTFRMILLLCLQIWSISLPPLPLHLFLHTTPGMVMTPSLCPSLHNSKGPTTSPLAQTLAAGILTVKKQLETRTYSIWTHRIPIKLKTLKPISNKTLEILMSELDPVAIDKAQMKDGGTTAMSSMECNSTWYQVVFDASLFNSWGYPMNWWYGMELIELIMSIQNKNFLC